MPFLHVHTHTSGEALPAAVQWAVRENRLKENPDEHLTISKECSHTGASCARAESVQYDRLLQACPQDLHVLLVMHSPEAHGWKMKSIVTEADVYYKTSQALFEKSGCTPVCAHNVTLDLRTCLKTHMYFPHVYPMSLFCPPPCRWWPVRTAGERPPCS